MQSKKLYTVIN